jgi:hypothetical protein
MSRITALVHVTVHIYRLNDDAFRFRVTFDRPARKTSGIEFVMRFPLRLAKSRRRLRELAICEAWDRATSKDIKRLCSSES